MATTKQRSPRPFSVSTTFNVTTRTRVELLRSRPKPEGVLRRPAEELSRPAGIPEYTTVIVDEPGGAAVRKLLGIGSK